MRNLASESSNSAGGTMEHRQAALGLRRHEPRPGVQTSEALLDIEILLTGKTRAKFRFVSAMSVILLLPWRQPLGRTTKVRSFAIASPFQSPSPQTSWQGRRGARTLSRGSDATTQSFPQSVLYPIHFRGALPASHRFSRSVGPGHRKAA